MRRHARECQRHGRVLDRIRGHLLITSPLDGVKLGVTSGVVDPPEAPELTKYDVMSVGAIYPGHLPHKATVTGVR